MRIDLATKSRISNFISTHENALRRVVGGVWTFVGVSVISDWFGFSTLLSSLVIKLILTAAGVFVPSSGIALMLVIYMVLQVLNLSQSVGIVLLLMYLFFYGFCYAYKAKHMNLLPGITVLYRLSIPYAAPMMAGLFGEYHEVTTVISGSAIAYYMKSVHDAVPTLSESGSATGGLDILSSMIGNSGFYFFMAAMITMFLVVTTVRNIRSPHSWILAVMLGVLSEALIMSGGEIFFGQGPGAANLFFGNVFTAVVGFLAALFFQNLDYTRVERVQFEDDDYYYYVTAVPKIHISEEDKEIKRITPDAAETEEADEKEVKA
ncbi:MAG: hypothetical protein PUF16_08225 [Lachnospiraceae bacterium]|nr:hypothetical protein [Lachnospiraceae bacterium]